MLKDLLQDDNGLSAVRAWVQMWMSGAIEGQAAALWQRAVVIALPKPAGGVRPICLQEAPIKLVELAIVRLNGTKLQQAVGRAQLGAGMPGGAQVALEMLRAAASAPETDEMVSTDIANAFGSLLREKVFAAVSRRAPFLLPYLVAAWPSEGTCLWTAGPGGWIEASTLRGVLQGSPLAALLFAIGLEEVLCDASIDDLVHRLAYADDLTMWGGEGSLSGCWPQLCAALAEAGLEMKIVKCKAWRPKDPTRADPVISGIPVDSGLVVLGSGVFDGAATIIGTPDHADKPTAERAQRACRLAAAISRMVRARVDSRGAHVGFVLLQRVVCPALEWDLRTSPPGVVESHAADVHSAVLQALSVIFSTDGIDGDRQVLVAAPADIGGLAFRLPSRAGAGAAARWAALEAALPPAKRLASDLSMHVDWTAADEALAVSKDALEQRGAGTGDGRPIFTDSAHADLCGCPVTAAAALQDALKECGRPGGRSRLQGQAGRIADLTSVARAWPGWSARMRETVSSTAGDGEGTLWSDCSFDERDGWLQDHHFSIAFLSRLGLPLIASGHHCSLTPSSGPRRGQPCGRALDCYGRHADGQCRAGGHSTRIHNAVGRRLAKCLRDAGLRADEEIVLPELHRISSGGAVVEGRMDIVVSRPGGLSRWLVDVRTVDAQAARSIACGGAAAALDAAGREKHRRYDGRAWAFAVEQRGRLAPEAHELLQVFASEVALLSACLPSALVRRWRRAIALVLAFETGERLRSAFVGREVLP